jgi:hypothetical protein
MTKDILVAILGVILGGIGVPVILNLILRR